MGDIDYEVEPSIATTVQESRPVQEQMNKTEHINAGEVGNHPKQDSETPHTIIDKDNSSKIIDACDNTTTNDGTDNYDSHPAAIQSSKDCNGTSPNEYCTITTTTTTTTITSKPPENDVEYEDDEPTPSYNNINPLNHSQDMEMETIRNSYKTSENDHSDSASTSSEVSDNSPNMPTKRVTMFQSVPLPDDFLLSAALTIRTSILAGDTKRKFLDDSDFQTTKKYRISMAGDKKSQIKDFAPVVFSHIRKKYGVSMQAYLMSWSDDRIMKQKATGKSDACFVHSPDRKFILKTIPKSEAKRLRKMLMAYYQHLEAFPDSLLSKIFGLHRVDRTKGLPRIYFAIFNNVFDSNSSFKEIYDLKGSSVGRRASAGDLVMKDLDLGDKKKIHLPNHLKMKVLDQIKVDCNFLAKNRLMDYSLLVGIRRAEDPPTEPPAPKVPPPDQRLPGLLFFLESTKIEESPPKRTVVTTLRRKSLTIGKPLFASMEDLLEGDGIEAIAAQNLQINMKLTTEDTTGVTTTSSSSDASCSAEEPTQHDALSSSSQNGMQFETSSHMSNGSALDSSSTASRPPRAIALSDSQLRPASAVMPEAYANKSLQYMPSAPILKGSFSKTASNQQFHLLTSSSVPNLNALRAGSGIYSNPIDCGHVPFYQQDEGGLRSPRQEDANGGGRYFEIYHFGIIDFLQRYNKKKKLANFAKSLKYEKEALSTVEPTFYMNRFLKMAEKVVGGE